MTPPLRDDDDNDLNERIRKTQTEVRWEGRLWTLFQLGMVALVGFLTMQAVETQKILAQMNTEMRYVGMRLDKIERTLDSDGLVREHDVTRAHDLIDRRMTTIESRVTSIAEALADIRRRMGTRQ